MDAEKFQSAPPSSSQLLPPATPSSGHHPQQRYHSSNSNNQNRSSRPSLLGSYNRYEYDKRSNYPPSSSRPSIMNSSYAGQQSGTYKANRKPFYKEREARVPSLSRPPPPPPSSESSAHRLSNDYPRRDYHYNASIQYNSYYPPSSSINTNDFNRRRMYDEKRKRFDKPYSAHDKPAFRDYNLKKPRLISQRPRLLENDSRSGSAAEDDEEHMLDITDVNEDTKSKGGDEDGDDDSSSNDEDAEEVDTERAEEDEDDDKEDKNDEAKENITGKMDALDDEISKYETMLEILMRQKREAEMQQAKSSRPSSPIFAAPPSPMLSKGEDLFSKSPRLTKFGNDTEAIDIVQKILKENRLKAKKAASTPQLRLPSNLESKAPLYTNLSDLPFYEENLKKHQVFRQVLIEKIKKKREEEEDITLHLLQEYYELYGEWQIQVAKWENNQRKKQEKILGKDPDFIRRNRITDDPMMNHPAAGDYDPTILPFSYLNPEDDFRFVKTLARVNDMIVDDEEREKVRFINYNAMVEDTLHTIRNRNQINSWLPEEKTIFLQKYLEFPKEFGRISAFLPNKTAQDCVLFYYLNKKPLKLKSLTRQALSLKNKRRRRAAQDRPMIDIMKPTAMRDHSDYEQVPIERKRQESIPFTEISYDNNADNGLGKYVEFEESFWEPEDLQKAKELFLDIGKDFKKIAATVGSKTVLQVRNLFMAYKRDRGIDLSSAESIADGGSRKERKRLRMPKENRSRVSLGSSNPPSASIKETNDLPSTVADDEASEVDSSHTPGATTQLSLQNPDSLSTDLPEKKKAKRGRPAKPRPPPVEYSEAESSVAPLSPHGTDDKREKKRTISYWTAKEKMDFMKYFPLHGKNWKALCDLIPTKSEIQIRNYYQNHKVSLGLVESRRPEREDEFDKVEDLSAASMQEAKMLNLEKDESKHPMLLYPPAIAPFPYPYNHQVSADGQMRYAPYPVYAPPIYPSGSGRPLLPGTYPPPLYALPPNAQPTKEGDSPGLSKSIAPYPNNQGYVYPNIAPQPLSHDQSASSSLETLAKLAAGSPRLLPLLPLPQLHAVKKESLKEDLNSNGEKKNSKDEGPSTINNK